MHQTYAAGVLVLVAAAFVAAVGFRGWWRRERPRPAWTLELTALALAALGGALAGIAVVLHVHILAHPLPLLVGSTAIALAALVVAYASRHE